MVALNRLARSAQSTTQTGLWTAEGYRRFHPEQRFSLCRSSRIGVRTPLKIWLSRRRANRANAQSI